MNLQPVLLGLFGEGKFLGMPMRVKFWGVRGSLPSPHSPEVIEQRLKSALHAFFSQGHKSADEIEGFLQKLKTEDGKAKPKTPWGGYGGNTACVEVSFDAGSGSISGAVDGSVIIDGGSGIRLLGEKLMQGPLGAGKGECHIFFTHFHWDHLIGLPFFVPLFVPGNKIHMYAVQPELETCIRALFKKPFFPVPFEDLRSTIQFHVLEPRKQVSIGGMSITPYQLDHPDPCWGYRVEAGGKSYAHCVDTEATRTSRANLGPDLPLYENADLVLFDAQYTLLEAAEKINWGHSAGPIGLELALRENVKRILFAHHDPGASDEKITDAALQTHQYLQICRDEAKRAGGAVPDLVWSFAREGQEIEL